MAQSGDRTIHKFGYNFGVAGTEVDIRSDDASLVYNTAAQSLEIVSGDINDDFIPTGTLTLSSAVAITGADGTATLTSVLAGDFCTINGLVYTAVSGATVEGEFDIDGNNDADAADLARAINDDTRAGTEGDCSATSATNVVTITTDVTGADGNDVTLTTDDATIVVSGSGTLTGGLDADLATVNGLVYTAISGSKAGDNTKFSIDTSDTLAAVDLADSINNDVRTPITVPTISVTATSATAVVTINALTGGSAGNTIDIVGTANITASAATLTDIDAAGAWTVLVEGLDGNYNEISETINLNGQIANALTKTYLIVHKARIVTAGTTGNNQGVITIRIASGGATQITIPILEGQSESANYTIPAGFRGEIILIHYNTDKGTDNLIRLKARDNTVTGAVWQTKFIESVTQASAPIEFKNEEFLFGEKTDIKFTTIRITGSDDDRVTISYTIILHRGA